MPCTSPPPSSSTTTRAVSTPISRNGSSGSRPEKPHNQYAHNRGEDNADAHLKRTLMGREVVVAVTEGQLDFGPWEQVFYGEFDGLRRKRVLVKIIGE
ncbi:MAG: YjbQ family protein [Opitutaceae bacterium]